MRMSYLLKSMLVTSAFGLGACTDTTTTISTNDGEAPNAVVSFDTQSDMTANFSVSIDSGVTKTLDASSSNDKETDNADLEYYWNGVKGESTYPLLYTTNDEGLSNEIVLWVKDGDGNSSATLKIKVGVNKPGSEPVETKPVVTFNPKSGFIAVNTKQNITVNIDDATAITTYTIDGGSKKTLSGSSVEIDASGKAKDDLIKLVITSTNAKGTTVSEASYTVTDDVIVISKPNVTLSKLSGSITVETKQTIIVTVDGEAVTTTYTIDGGAEQTLSGSSIEIDATGKTKDDLILLEVTSTNAKGSSVVSGSYTVTNDIITPTKPEITLSAVDGEIVVNQSKEITVTISESDATTTYSIDDGAAQNLVNGQITIDAAGKAAGDLIKLTVNSSNEAGAATPVMATYKVVAEPIEYEVPVLTLDNSSADVEQDQKITVQISVLSEIDANTTYDIDGTETSTTDKTISIEIDATGKAVGDKVVLTVTSVNATGDAKQISGTYTVTAKPDTNTAEFTWDNANIYFVLTDRFKNGDTSNDESYGRKKDYGSTELNTGTFHGGDIKGLTDKLEENYFTDLGVNAIWITAPYEQVHGWTGGGESAKGKTFPHYAYHGYYPMDFTSIDKNMGTVEEFRTFVDTAHAQGIRVVMDVVMNHVGYNTLLDMEQYDFAGFKDGATSSWTPSDGKWDTVWQAVDWGTDTNSANWENWWSTDWIAAGLKTYTDRPQIINGVKEPGWTDINSSLNGLPDVRTETTSAVTAPPFLKNKWAQESSGYENWIIPAAASLRKDLNAAPADYINQWLVAWVEEFGIDAFRIDTAKHVEMHRWSELKDAGVVALAKWRANNPNNVAAKWDDQFWTTGEVWNHGPNKSDYHTSGKFDSIINFNFPKDGNTGSIANTWASYANSINGDSSFNTLSYINSHDHKEFGGWSQTTKAHGTTLLLSPGGVQIYYGDENSRDLGPEMADPNQSTRSDYQWGNNPDILAHWQKLGQFRRDNAAVGAGSHEDLGNGTYGRKWTSPKTGNENKVVFVINASGTVNVNVDGYFADGSTVRNAYDDDTTATATVSGGKVSFAAGSNGVILIEAQ